MPKPRKPRSLDLLRLDRVSLVDKGDNPEAHIMIHKRAEAKFSKGDRVKISTPHMDMKKGDMGVIAEVSSETAYAVKMDGEKKAHRWYTDSEMEPAESMQDDMDTVEKAIQRGMSFQRRCNEVEKAVQAKWGGEGWAYCKETFDNAVVFEQGGKQWLAPYSMEESEGEMNVSLGDREQAETVYETQKGESMTAEQIMQKFTALEGTLAETQKRAERAEAITKLNAAERAVFEKLDVAKQDEYLAGDAAVREKLADSVKPAKAEPTDVEKRLAAQEAENANLAKRLAAAEEEAELARYAKRATVEIPNTPGTDDDKGRMLRAVDKIADAEVRKAALAALKAGDAALATLGKQVGTAGKDEPSGAEAKLEAAVAKIVSEEKVSVSKAWGIVMDRHPELYREYRAEKQGVN